MRFKNFTLCALWGFVFASTMLVSCKPEPIPEPQSFSIGKGVLVLNEGAWMSGQSTLTFYDPDADTVLNGLPIWWYENGNVEQTPWLGDVGQSLSLVDGKLFIVANSSNFIRKVNAHTMQDEGQVNGLYSPRYMYTVAPNKAYVTDICATELLIINPSDMSLCGSVELGKPTEKMVQVGNELYVSNWSNYYQPDTENNTVQVVDVANDVKVAEIQVGKEPNCMAVDKNGKVWVLCEGASWDPVSGENPSLWRIDPMTKQAVREYVTENYVTNLTINEKGDELYMFSNGDVVSLSIENPSSETLKIASEGRSFYNMAVNPLNGDIYVTDAGDYISNGTVYRYTSDGVGKGSFQAGIIPSAIVFN